MAQCTSGCSVVIEVLLGCGARRTGDVEEFSQSVEVFGSTVPLYFARGIAAAIHRRFATESRTSS